MAVWTGRPHAAEVQLAAQAWRAQCLLKDGSLFSYASLWTLPNFEALKRDFVDNPLEGPASFIDKLKDQLSASGPAVQQLAAECLWLLSLFVSADQMGPAAKRQRITAIWSMSGAPLPDSPLLAPPALDGLAKPGAAYMTRQWAELEFLVRVMIAWKQLSADDRGQMLAPGGSDAFCAWLTTQPAADARALRHMLLYFCFPDRYERICSHNHKMRIYQALKTRLAAGDDPYAHNASRCALDQAILAIRRSLEAELGTADLDFYLPPLRQLWLEQNDGAPEPVAPAPPRARRFWIEKSLVAGRVDRTTGDHRLGQALWSPQRSKSGSDIYASMRAVQPGDVVFHLTDNAGFTDVSVVASSVDDTFGGVPGTDWSDRPCYRVQLKDHEPLSPILGRDAFLDTEPFAGQLKRLADASRGLFFNSQRGLNQGAYLTEATPALLAILNAAYRRVAGRNLPYIDGEAAAAAPLAASYPVERALEHLFLERAELEELLTLWAAKKNVVLQGPPGVGKSFTARRLAYALIGAEEPARLGFVQFHQSYAYEDFVQGYRPVADGFALRRGKFVQFCDQARAQPDQRHVFIIDEINRGNLSRILGELMLLIEPDKRSERWAMPLAYGDARFFVPDNVYLLGLMNTADRSLAVVDYALRRRFAFVDLTPRLASDKFAAELASRGVDAGTVAAIRSRVGALNAEIEGDLANLGPGFAIGHSFFCAGAVAGETNEAWYQRVVKTEILPLLREYWFDAPAKVAVWAERLLAPL